MNTPDVPHEPPRRCGGAGVVFEPLTNALVDSAWALSTQAGWEQTREDWRRLARLTGGGVWVWTDEGEVRASFSLVGYGSSLAWIGMILVDREYRGRGLGRESFAAALDAANARSFDALGLDATDQGAPIYRKFGFAEVCPITRWRGNPRPTKPTNAQKVILDQGIAEWDREVCGLDRSALLADLAASGAQFLSVEGGNGRRAYGVLRPSRTAWFLGPVAASTPADFHDIVRGASEHCGGGELICDVLHEAASPCLIEAGLSPQRHLSRMVWPQARSVLCGPSVWCGAGFEIG